MLENRPLFELCLEETREQWYKTWKEFPLIHPLCTSRFASAYRSMEEVLKNTPLIKRILEDDEYEGQRELVNSMINIKLLGLIKYLKPIDYS